MIRTSLVQTLAPRPYSESLARSLEAEALADGLT
jgi:hypothetical protein